jgi:hypothetical protein
MDVQLQITTLVACPHTWIEVTKLRQRSHGPGYARAMKVHAGPVCRVNGPGHQAGSLTTSNRAHDMHIQGRCARRSAARLVAWFGTECLHPRRII